MQPLGLLWACAAILLHYKVMLRKVRAVKDKTRKSKKADKAVATVARVTEITASSSISFDDAISAGVERACKTLENVTGAWIQEQKLDVEDGRIVKYRVNMKVTFILRD